MSVAIIERKLFGGACVNVGWTPTKTLVANAYAAHIVRRAADFGMAVGGPVSVDMKQVKARKDAVVGDRTAASSSGCELEIHALNNAFYDVERFGLRFVASPRYA